MFAVLVVLPTPPLPLVTTITRASPAGAAGSSPPSAVASVREGPPVRRGHAQRQGPCSFWPADQPDLGALPDSLCAAPTLSLAPSSPGARGECVVKPTERGGRHQCERQLPPHARDFRDARRPPCCGYAPRQLGATVVRPAAPRGLFPGTKTTTKAGGRRTRHASGCGRTSAAPAVSSQRHGGRPFGHPPRDVRARLLTRPSGPALRPRHRRRVHLHAVLHRGRSSTAAGLRGVRAFR